MSVSYGLYYSLITTNTKKETSETVDVVKNEELSEEALAEREVKESEILKKEEAIRSTFSAMSTTENKKIYLEYVDNLIKNTQLSDQTKDILLFRKATILSVIRDQENQKAEIDESIKIFNIFINRKSSDPTDTYLRDFSIIALVKLLLQAPCCSDLTIKDYPDIYDKYTYYNKTLEYSEDISKLLALNDLLKSSSPYIVEKDISNMSERLALTRRIIAYDYNNNQVKRETLDSLVGEVGTILENFNKGEPLTFKDHFNTKMEAKFQYASSYGSYMAYKTKGKPTAQENKEINAIYDEAFVAISQSEKIDPVSAKSIQYFLFLSYLSSIDTRYNDKDAELKLEKQITTLTNNVKSIPELRSQIFRYLSGGIDKDGKVIANSAGTILIIGNKYPKVKNLFTNELKLKYSI